MVSPPQAAIDSQKDEAVVENAAAALGGVLRHEQAENGAPSQLTKSLCEAAQNSGNPQAQYAVSQYYGNVAQNPLLQGNKSKESEEWDARAYAAQMLWLDMAIHYSRVIKDISAYRIQRAALGHKASAYEFDFYRDFSARKPEPCMPDQVFGP